MIRKEYSYRFYVLVTTIKRKRTGLPNKFGTNF